jgi:hypothetical protein
VSANGSLLALATGGSLGTTLATGATVATSAAEPTGTVEARKALVTGDTSTAWTSRGAAFAPRADVDDDLAGLGTAHLGLHAVDAALERAELLVELVEDEAHGAVAAKVHVVVGVARVNLGSLANLAEVDIVGGLVTAWVGPGMLRSKTGLAGKLTNGVGVAAGELQQQEAGRQRHGDGNEPRGP